MSTDTVKIIKLPGPMRIIWGSLGCYWLSGIVHAGFFGIASMLLSIIPILVIKIYFPRQFEKFPPHHSV